MNNVNLFSQRLKMERDSSGLTQEQLANKLVVPRQYISDFENGKKIKESVYNDAYELINTFVPEYNDDLRTKLQILDKDGNIQISAELPPTFYDGSYKDHIFSCYN